MSNSLSPPSTAKLQPGDLIDEREYAKIIGASVNTLRNWRSLGRGPKVYRFGRLVRYMRPSLVDESGRDVA
jgi:hypothetical protein